ncbi:MAG: hypothetical protein IJG68_01345 [Bacilli bacterium]|nr:hypothetical protein [Bacilli bacterium]
MIKKKEKKMKDYLLLAFIYLITIIMVLYFCKSYIVYREYQKEIPVISGSLMEIMPDDLEHYIIDNPEVVVYMCSAPDDKCREFEKKLKKYIKKKEITDEIIYLNLTNVDLEQFTKDFNKKYPNTLKLNQNYPAFVFFADGKNEAILQEKKDKKLTISKLNVFLETIWAEEEEETTLDNEEQKEE